MKIFKLFIILAIGGLMAQQTMANTSKLNGPSEGYAPTNKGKIYYKSLGQGPTIILIHGGPGLSHNHFMPQMQPLS